MAFHQHSEMDSDAKNCEIRPNLMHELLPAPIQKEVKSADNSLAKT
jgi:hypothetical protein